MKEFNHANADGFYSSIHILPSQFFLHVCLCV